MKLRSERNPNLVYPIEGWEQSLDARAEDGALLRPYIVFFGESVPMFEPACEVVSRADILIVVGTSLAVYPAASLVHYVRPNVPIYLVDPGTPDTRLIRNPLTHIKERGAVGVPQLVERLRNEFEK
jgi:NAD-dependent deacetylase